MADDSKTDTAPVIAPETKPAPEAKKPDAPAPDAPKKPDVPSKPDVVAPSLKNDPELNALVEQTRALNSRLDAAEKARAEAEHKAAKATASEEIEKTFTKLGYTDDPEQRANLRDIVGLHTHIVDGKQVWRGDDGKDYPIEHGLTEFQKGRGKHFVRAASRKAPSENVLKGDSRDAHSLRGQKVTFKSLARDLKIAR